MQTMMQFLDEIREYLSTKNLTYKGEKEYINLADMSFDESVPEVHLLGYPHYNPVLPIFEIILDQIRKNRVDRIQVAINELLKYYLANPDGSLPVSCKEIMYRIELIFERCLRPDFPYTGKLWDFINLSLQNFSMYLLLKEHYEESTVALDTLAHLGRQAAQEGLPTAVTQSALRLIEVEARRLNQDSIAAQAKNYRFNLEI